MGRKIKNMRQQRIKVPVTKQILEARNKKGEIIREAFTWNTHEVRTVLHKK